MPDGQPHELRRRDALIGDALWLIEERFWTAADAPRDTLDPGCIMAFPAPTGLLAGPGIADSLSGAPRWTRVEMTERRLAQPAPDVAVLAYRARGVREGAAPYEAFCTSTYRVSAGAWRLIQHQQTPI